jgi:hypothetical protein
MASGDVHDKQGGLIGNVIPGKYSIDLEDEVEETAEADLHADNEEEEEENESPDSNQQESIVAEDPANPIFFNHITISRDLSGTNDEVASKLLSALVERSNRDAFAAFAERSNGNKFVAFIDNGSESKGVKGDTGSRSIKEREDKIGAIGAQSRSGERNNDNKFAAINRESRFMNADLTLLAKRR